MISDTYKVRVNLGLCALAAAITLAEIGRAHV